MASKNFDYKFLTDPDDSLKCCICLEVAREPKQEEECGKLFCSECIEKNGSEPCPICRAQPPKYFNDKKSLREIKALHVSCDNVERSCDWEGTVGTLEDHVTKCGFTLVSCPNKCKAEGKDLQLKRKDLGDHRKTWCPNRDYECEDCGEKGTYTSIQKEHDKVCKKKIVSCSNTECTVTMERCQTEEHLRTCNYTVVACKYASIGCGEKKIRKDIRQHQEYGKCHLPLTLEKIVTLDRALSSSKKEITTLKKTISSLVKDDSSLKETTLLLKLEIDTLKNVNSFTLRFPGYGQKKERDKKFLSEPFFTSPGGYKMCIRLYPNGYDEAAHMSVYCQLLKGQHDDKLPWPFKGTVTIELLNQLADANHHSMDVVYVDNEHARPGSGGSGHHQFILHSALSHDPARNTQYLMEDTLYFRVTVKVDNHKPWLDSTLHFK